MIDTKIVSIFAVIVFLFIGCEEPTKAVVLDSSTNKNTLNNPDLGYETGRIEDYFYSFDTEINAQYLYYNAFITRGINSAFSPTQLNPFIDTLNFRTFPYYVIEVEAENVTVSSLVSITPENIDNYSKLYPLNEKNASENNWCNEMLVEYSGDCKDSVEVPFDYYTSTGSVGIIMDTLYSKPEFPKIESVKKYIFNDSWTNVDSIKWDSELGRYSVIKEEVNDTTKISISLTSTEDLFDSLIYIGVIDTNQYSVNDLMFVDRMEWIKNTSTYYENDYLVLDTLITYGQIIISPGSPMFQVNGDCNQNLKWDGKEEYFDYGADWCPDSLETGDDTYTDTNGDGNWDAGEPLIIDWNNDGTWTRGFCKVVDTNGDRDILDEVPCGCLGDWRNEDIINSTWEPGSTDDPNGDNWRDCGWDSICPNDAGYDAADANGTELNGYWDNNEGFEENISAIGGGYDFDIVTGTGEYFIDLGNDVFDAAEYCLMGIDDICDGDEPFEDRNCNGKWDDDEEEDGLYGDGNFSNDKGNGIWDDEEDYIDLNGNKVWDGDGDLDGDEPLHYVGLTLGTFLVDYTDPTSPTPVQSLDFGEPVTLFYGTASNPKYVTYNDIIKYETISKTVGESFLKVDSITTIYTNKIIESKIAQSPLSGVASHYNVTKTKWYQDDNLGDRPNYAYDYHLFTISEDGNVNKMVHPEYFSYYGYYWFSLNNEEIEEGFWEADSAIEDVYIYTVNNEIRAGEYYYSDTTVITPISEYYIENTYEVDYDTSLVVPFRKVLYQELSSGDTVCVVPSEIYSVWEREFGVNTEVDPPNNCPPADTTLKNTFKITKTRIITMIGNGLECGLRNTIWLGTEGVGTGKPLGIVKDQLEIRWSESFRDDFGEGWHVLSRIELSSLRNSNSVASGLLRSIINPVKYLTTNQLGGEDFLDNDTYEKNATFGLHRIRLPDEE